MSLKELRKKKHLTLAELSEKTGIAISTLSRYETKERTPTFKNFKMLAKALSVSEKKLLELFGE